MFETSVSLPSWVSGTVDFSHPYGTDEERMRLAIRLARENVERGTGGPFGAAVFEAGSGILVAAAVNCVVRLNNSTLHAEMVAIQLAQKRVASWTLDIPGQPTHELFTSCAPCVMCLGGVHWSGIRRLVCAAEKADAEAIGFDEGPVSDASYAHLERNGITVVRGFLRAESAEVLRAYGERRGTAY
jgi:tRNA(Arg) A34 adenosine deaminase TadA